MHKLKREFKAYRSVLKDTERYFSEEGIFMGRTARKNRVITVEPYRLNKAIALKPYHLNRAYRITIW